MKELIIKNEGISYDVKNQRDAVKAIFEEQERFPDVSMYDILASVELKGFTVEEVFEIYAECMKESDGDTVVRITSDLNDADDNIIDFINREEVIGIKNGLVECVNCSTKSKTALIVGKIRAYENVENPSDFIDMKITANDNVIASVLGEKDNHTIDYDALTDHISKKFNKDMAFDEIEDGITYICKKCHSENIY